MNGDGSLFERGTMVAHCLLVETDAHGLVLVDTGIGTEDVRDPKRLGPWFAPLMNLGKPDAKMPALPQLEAMGFKRDDVRHLVLTHLDVDHAGGLPDFPQAAVHVHVNEKSAALDRKTLHEKMRYRPAHLAHGPAWATYDATGEPWKGLPAVRALAGLPPEILAIPMPGHTRGHAAIAVNVGARWLVHGGDAYFHRSILDDAKGPMPWGLRTFENYIAMDGKKVRENHARLRELSKEKDVTVFSAHDQVEYNALCSGV